MQLLLLPVLSTRQPSILFADLRLLRMSPELLTAETPPPPPADDDDEGCKLLDGFAIIVQISLATTALLVLIYKRWRERPQRPVPIWALDVSKQFLGAGVIHFLNLLVSYLAGRPMDGPRTNLCVWYFLNVFIDTTLGVGVLWFWLHTMQWVLERVFHVPYIRTGCYGPPPLRRQLGPWARQTAVFIIAEGLMKFCVYEMFRFFPVLFALGDWALRWTRGNYRYQVVFVMFIFPLIMNAVQFWIVDTIVKVTPVAKHLQGSKYSANAEYMYTEASDDPESSPPHHHPESTTDHERTPLLQHQRPSSHASV